MLGIASVIGLFFLIWLTRFIPSEWRAAPLWALWVCAVAFCGLVFWSVVFPFSP